MTRMMSPGRHQADFQPGRELHRLAFVLLGVERPLAGADRLAFEVQPTAARSAFWMPKREIIAWFSTTASRGSPRNSGSFQATVAMRMARPPVAARIGELAVDHIGVGELHHRVGRHVGDGDQLAAGPVGEAAEDRGDLRQQVEGLVLRR